MRRVILVAVLAILAPTFAFAAPTKLTDERLANICSRQLAKARFDALGEQKRQLKIFRSRTKSMPPNSVGLYGKTNEQNVADLEQEIRYNTVSKIPVSKFIFGSDFADLNAVSTVAEAKAKVKRAKDYGLSGLVLCAQQARLTELQGLPLGDEWMQKPGFSQPLPLKPDEQALLLANGCSIVVDKEHSVPDLKYAMLGVSWIGACRFGLADGPGFRRFNGGYTIARFRYGLELKQAANGEWQPVWGDLAEYVARFRPLEQAQVEQARAIMQARAARPMPGPAAGAKPAVRKKGR